MKKCFIVLFLIIAVFGLTSCTLHSGTKLPPLVSSTPVTEEEALSDDALTGVWFLMDGSKKIELTKDYKVIENDLHVEDYRLLKNHQIEMTSLKAGHEVTILDYEIQDGILSLKKSDSSIQRFTRNMEPVESAPVTRLIDFNDYQNLSSESQTYWFVRNTAHQPVAVGPKEILDKYQCIYQSDVNDRKVYITMDMGYENNNTSYILDIYKENDIKVLFFLTGDYIDNNEDLVRRMIDEGHMIGNHTNHHPILPGISLKEVYDEIMDLDDKLYDRFGIRSRYVRFPEGKYTEQILSMVKDMGFIPVFWNNAFDDWMRNDDRPSSYFYQRITENMNAGSLMLIHAVNRNEADCLIDVFEYINDNGYVLGEPLDLFK